MEVLTLPTIHDYLRTNLLPSGYADVMAGLVASLPQSKRRGSRHLCYYSRKSLFRIGFNLSNLSNFSFFIDPRLFFSTS